MRRALAAVAVGVAVFGISGVVAACSSSTYDGVCENTSTQLRTDDTSCRQAGQGSGGAPYIWVYYAAGQRIPAVGSSVGDGVRNPPAGANLANGGVSSGGSNGGDDNNNGNNNVGPANGGGDDDDNGGSGRGGGDDGGDEGGSGGGGGGDGE